MKYVAFFKDITLEQIGEFGGKNASLGQMIRDLSDKGIMIPSGFATNAQAYWAHLKSNGLVDEITALLKNLDRTDVKALHEVGATLRARIAGAPLPREVADEIKEAYARLSEHYDVTDCDVAVRSSATAEDLPTASFAGQQETFLHIHGDAALLDACRRCMASLFTDRALFYRATHGFDDMNVALSVGVQKMVRADKASSGIIFTLDTETGFPGVVTITSSYGLGEPIVQGHINPDEFVVYKKTLEQGFAPIIKKLLGSKKQELVYAHGTETRLVAVPELRQKKFSLSDQEILDLAKQALVIEQFYSDRRGSWCPMDIEWAKDDDGSLYIIQARPETVHSQKKSAGMVRWYSLKKKIAQESILLSGQSVGAVIVTGKVAVVASPDQETAFTDGDILVADMTDPDWVPLMKRASAIVTNRGGRTCHAAIVSRELGISAVIGTGNATDVLHSGQAITVDCSQGAAGFVYDGVHDYAVEDLVLADVPKLASKIMVNMANPDAAFRTSFLPVDGVGLARLEFIISSIIQIHPMAIVDPNNIEDERERREVLNRCAGYATPQDYFVDVLAQSVGMIAAAFYPKPVVVRLTDFKSNEYRGLLGGSYFEPEEENPMLGFRGAVRYCSERYRPAFALECAALKTVRERFGLTNMIIMVPFVRTVKEARGVVELLAHNGLQKGVDGLQLYMMVEVPSNVLLLKEFAPLFDGFSIGSNDLTQLVLGVDRDSSRVASLFDERDPAVMRMLHDAIAQAQALEKPIGICGQAPSDFPDLAKTLMEWGITSISLNTDSVVPFLMNMH